LLEKLVSLVKTDIVTFVDVATALSFYFNRPTQPSHDELATLAGEHLEAIRILLTEHLAELDDSTTFVKNIKENASQQKIPLKNVFGTLRRSLQGTPHGLALHDLVGILGTDEARTRLEGLLH
jgi:glutamyl/glutaminyl-tRNA synthetase